MKDKTIVKLICSAPTRPMLEKMINDYYYSDAYRIQDDGAVFHTRRGAVLDGVKVEQKRGRWRFGLV